MSPANSPKRSDLPTLQGQVQIPEPQEAKEKRLSFTAEQERANASAVLTTRILVSAQFIKFYQLV